MQWTFFILGGVATIVTLVALARRRGATADANDDGATGAATAVPMGRLVEHLRRKQQRMYRIFVDVPSVRRATWLAADGLAEDGNSVRLESDGRAVPCRAVAAFIVAYPNGEVVDVHQHKVAPLPAGLYFKDFAADPATLGPAEPARWKEGERLAFVRHGPARPNPNQPRTLSYATSVDNISGERIRVNWFGAYAREAGKLRPGNRYTADDFRQWYGVGADGWIRSGGKATDPNNWGVPGAIWTYGCVTERGTEFVVAAKGP
jgi:hypothetical protein